MLLLAEARPDNRADDNRLVAPPSGQYLYCPQSAAEELLTSVNITTLCMSTRQAGALFYSAGEDIYGWTVYIHTHIYMCIYTHTYIYTYYMHINLYTHIYICIHTYIHIYTYYMHIYIYTYIHSLHIYMYIYTYYIYIYTFSIYIYTCHAWVDW